MNDKDKTKEQLTYDLKKIQQQVAEVVVSEVEHNQTEEQLQKRTHDLGKRVKELNCLYGISSVADKQGVPLEEMFQEIVSLIPPSWQYPEVTCARIILNSQEFVTGNFRETEWEQTRDITVHDNRVGSVEVYYLEERQESDEGPFLREERNLINAIAEQVGIITERKQAEEQLQVSEKWLSATLRSIGDAVIATDAKGHVTLMNPTAQSLTGWNEEDAKGKPLEDVFNIINEEAGKQVENQVTKVIREGVTVGLVNDTILIAKDGARWSIDDSSAPIKDDMGNTTGIILVFRDCTEHKQMEEQLRHSQVLTSLGEMTAGIAHEMGNPLASIVLYSEVAMEGEGVPGQTKKDLRVIHSEAKRAGKLMKDLLAYSRKIEPQMRRVNVHSVIEQVVKMLQYRLKVQSIKITTDLFSRGTLKVNGDVSHLTQVFLNIIMNAEKAVKDSNGSNIVVSSNVEDGWVKIAVTDDGLGIPKENLDRIFLPFFTTKDIGEGTGLGLSMCYGIITAHGGTIIAENNEKGGATFTVTLPLLGRGRQEPLLLETEG